MKQKLLLLFFTLLVKIGYAQTYTELPKLDKADQNVYYSANAKERAVKIADEVAKAKVYFEQQFNVKPTYSLLVLAPADWKLYAHPNAIYGIPHYLPDGRLVVASENNDFWKRNTPPVDKIPANLPKD